MRLHGVLLWLPVVFLVGCDLFQSRPPGHPCFTTYQARGFALASVSRVLILPLANESPFPHAAEEIRSALAAELQTCGAFEVVVAPHHLELPVTPAVHVDGRFSEEAMLELAHAFRVDGVLLGSVTHYHPYSPPRIGLTLQLISPGLAMAVASVDGLWDARDRALADQARTYYRQSFNPLLALAEGDLPPPEGDLALSSPQLYQRFVCHQVTQALTRPPAPVAPPPPGETKPAAAKPAPAPEVAKPDAQEVLPMPRVKEPDTPSPLPMPRLKMPDAPAPLPVPDPNPEEGGSP